MSADDKLEPVAWLIGDPGTGRWVETSEARAEYSASIGRPVLPIITASALEASEAKIAALTDAATAALDRIAALTAENATLREALARIAKRSLRRTGYGACDMGMVPDCSAHEASNIARATLRQEGKP